MVGATGFEPATTCTPSSWLLPPTQVHELRLARCYTGVTPPPPRRLKALGFRGLGHFAARTEKPHVPSFAVNGTRSDFARARPATRTCDSVSQWGIDRRVGPSLDQSEQLMPGTQSSLRPYGHVWRSSVADEDGVRDCGRQIVGADRTPASEAAARSERRAASGPGPSGPSRHPLRSSERHPLADASPGHGLRQRHDLLAPAARLERGRGVAQVAPGRARRATSGSGHRLVARRAGRLERTGKKGGDDTGPNPTDRGKPGSKHHVMVDAQGLPLAIRLGPANEHDSKQFEELLDAVRPVHGRRGPPRKRPAKLHADKGYDFPRCRRACRDRSITPRIARRGLESRERLGRYRWIVERTLAWLHQFRRLAVRYERRSDPPGVPQPRVRAHFPQVR